MALYSRRFPSTFQDVVLETIDSHVSRWVYNNVFLANVPLAAIKNLKHKNSSVVYMEFTIL